MKNNLNLLMSLFSFSPESSLMLFDHAYGSRLTFDLDAQHELGHVRLWNIFARYFSRPE